MSTTGFHVINRPRASTTPTPSRPITPLIPEVTVTIDRARSLPSHVPDASPTDGNLLSPITSTFTSLKRKPSNLSTSSKGSSISSISSNSIRVITDSFVDLKDSVKEGATSLARKSSRFLKEALSNQTSNTEIANYEQRFLSLDRDKVAAAERQQFRHSRPTLYIYPSKTTSTGTINEKAITKLTPIKVLNQWAMYFKPRLAVSNPD